MWNRILVWFGLRTDWRDPRNSPPFSPDTPHEYESIDVEPVSARLGNWFWDDRGHRVRQHVHAYCKRCGGGDLHPIHHGAQEPRSTTTPDIAGLFQENMNDVQVRKLTPRG